MSYEAAHNEAWSRIYGMAREGLQTMRTMGVRSLHYETELLPGITRCKFVASYPGVVRVYLDFAPEVGRPDPNAPAMPREYTFPEAMLFRRDERAPSGARGVLPTAPDGSRT